MRKRTGFTLVELLVVIGIIAVLVSILLPALSRTREQARSLQCVTNIRAILQATLAYARDNDAVLPIPALYTEAQPVSASFAWLVPTKGVTDFQHGTLWPYLPQGVRRQVLNCPADLEDARIVRTGTVTVLPRNFSYSFNVQLRAKMFNPQVPNKTGIRLFNIVNPSEKIVVVEENWPNDACAYLAQNDMDDVPAARHLGRSNMGFADGHVEAFTPADLGFDIVAVKLTNPAANTHYCDLFKP